MVSTPAMRAAFFRLSGGEGEKSTEEITFTASQPSRAYSTTPSRCTTAPLVRTRNQSASSPPMISSSRKFTPATLTPSRSAPTMITSSVAPASASRPPTLSVSVPGRSSSPTYCPKTSCRGDFKRSSQAPIAARRTDVIILPLKSIVVAFPLAPHLVFTHAQVVDRRDQRPGTLHCNQHHRADTLPLRATLLVEGD